MFYFRGFFSQFELFLLKNTKYEYLEFFTNMLFLYFIYFPFYCTIFSQILDVIAVLCVTTFSRAWCWSRRLCTDRLYILTTFRMSKTRSITTTSFSVLLAFLWSMISTVFIILAVLPATFSISPFLGVNGRLVHFATLLEYGYEQVDRGRFSGHATPVSCRIVFLFCPYQSECG